MLYRLSGSRERVRLVMSSTITVIGTVSVRSFRASRYWHTGTNLPDCIEGHASLMRAASCVAPDQAEFRQRREFRERVGEEWVASRAD
jgi:hypothetical protein